MTSALIRLGMLQSASGDATAARSTLTRALSIAESNAGPRGKRADVFEALGNACIATGDFDNARKYLSRAIDLNASDKAATGKVQLCSSLDSLAEVEAHDNKPAEAADRVLRASFEIDNYIRQVFMQLPFQEQCKFAATAERQINFLMTYCRAPQYLDNSLKSLINWKGLLLNTLRQQTVSSHSTDPETAECIHAVREAQLRLAEFASSDSKDSPNERQEQLKTLSDQVREKEELLSDKLKGGAYLDPAQNIDAAAFRKLIADDEAFVDIEQFADPLDPTAQQYGAIVVSKSKPTTFVELGSASTIDSTIHNWLASVLNSNSGPVLANDPSSDRGNKHKEQKSR
ncbi:MAG: tetratricopeptide repeat protein, partial [Terriglobales bacterium]